MLTRSGSVVIAGAAVLAGLGALGTVAQADVPVTQCGSVKMNRYYKPTPSGRFGATQIGAQIVSCAQAKQVAATFVENPYSVGAKGQGTVKIGAWHCAYGPDNQASQTVAVACGKQGGALSFLDTIPNG